MKRINMIKHGFVRDPKEDFSDDGNFFYCYAAGRVRVSKLVADGEAYISGRIDGNLDYDVYSKLPHYQYMDDLNGVDVETLTDEDLQTLYRNCLEYTKEYEAEEAKIVYPEKDEIVKALTKRVDELKRAYNEACKLVQENSISLLLHSDTYAFSNVRDMLKEMKREMALDIQKRADELVNTVWSIKTVASADKPYDAWRLDSLKKSISELKKYANQ